MRLLTLAYVLRFSLLGRSRFCASPAALDNRLESANEKEGEDWYCLCYESRRVVSLRFGIWPSVFSSPPDFAPFKCRRGLNRQDNILGGIIEESRLYL